MAEFHKTTTPITSSLSGGRLHFPIREETLVLEKSIHVLQRGENPYTLALALFNDDKLYYFIADINEPKDPMQWETGEIIKLPQVIIQQSEAKLESY